MANSRRDEERPALPEEEQDEGPVDEETRTWGWLWSVGKLVVGLCIVLTAAGGVAYGARYFAVTSDRFAVRDFQASGSRRYSAEQLAAKAGVRLGDNLFALEPVRLQGELAEDPWLESVKITRKLPETLIFEVTEYQAEALAAIGSTLYLVTRDGHPIVALGTSEVVDLPVVTGVSPDDIAADRARALERVAKGLELLRHYARLSLSKTYAVQEIHLDRDGAVSLVVGNSAISLQLGKPPFRQKLLMADRILKKVSARGQLPGTVFLDNEAHPERVVVRLR